MRGDALVVRWARDSRESSYPLPRLAEHAYARDRVDTLPANDAESITIADRGERLRITALRALAIVDLDGAAVVRRGPGVTTPPEDAIAPSRTLGTYGSNPPFPSGEESRQRQWIGSAISSAAAQSSATNGSTSKALAVADASFLCQRRIAVVVSDGVPTGTTRSRAERTARRRRLPRRAIERA